MNAWASIFAASSDSDLMTLSRYISETIQNTVTVRPTIEAEYETIPNLSIQMVTFSMTLNNCYNHDFKVTPLVTH